MNQLYEREYDEALESWNKAASSLQPLNKRTQEAINSNTTYYLTDDDCRLLEQEREASLRLNEVRQKYFGNG